MKRIIPRDAAAQLCGSPLTIMLDIDGTLCDIAERPGDAVIPPEAAASLRKLNGAAESGVSVAFVTGRSVADAREMLCVDRALIYGSHGAERLSPSGNIRGPAGWETNGRVLNEAATELESLTKRFPGSKLEDKRYSLSLHYRGIDVNEVPELKGLASEIAHRWRLRVVEGKCVINLLPPNAANKGDAVREIVRAADSGRAPASVLFVGDDVTDEDAFMALREMDNAVTIRVGSPDSESAAKFYFCTTGEVHDLLGLLANLRR